MGRSIMQHSAALAPGAEIPRSTFNRSHSLKTTIDSDDLVPIYVDEVLPADTFRMKCSALIRLNSPTLHPLMDNLYADIHFFFVPSRTLWAQFEKFHGAQDNPGDSISFTIPALSSTTNINITTADALLGYMGLPWVTSLDGSEINALPFRAYNKIWNDWYRDENLQNSITELTTNGPDGHGNYTLQKRGKRFDYFTGALPSPQKGAAVELGLAGTAYVEGIGVGLADTTTAGPTTYRTPVGNVAFSDYYTDVSDTIALDGKTTDGEPNVYVDLSTASAFSVNDIRMAFQTQRLLERDMRSGTRYVEHLAAHYGITNYPDGRLQRPEYLGGGTINVQINSVPNTSEDATQKQGELTGFGVGAGQAYFSKSFVEHGYVLGLVSVRSDLTYSQGLDRMWSRSTRYDFAYPVLANVGEEAILDKEIYYNSGDGMNDDVWGYTPRYESYRFKNSRLTGLMHVDHASTLASWHLSEDFGSRPSLNANFIQGNTVTPLDRAIALPSEPQFNCDFYFDLRCARPLPLYGIPGNIDRF